MTERMTILAFLLLLPPPLERLRAQTDPVYQSDSIPGEVPPEDLVRQGAEADDSPLIDLSPFDRQPKRHDYLVNIRSRVNFGLERSRGYERGIFLGSPLKLYQRIELSNRGGIGAGALIEKDAGEPRLADFASGYAIISSDGPLQTVLLGDYIVEAGQGIALWRGYDYGKGADVVKPAKRSGRGILPYRSSDESAFLRGAAAEARIGRYSASVFYSHHSLSASVDSSGAVSAMYTSGIFRTGAEESKRGNVTESLFGFRNSIGMGERGNAGMTFYRAGFSRPLRLSGESRYSGEGYSLASVDYGFDLRPVVLFGEWTILCGPAAGVSGALLAPSTALEIVAALRHYPGHFSGLHGLGLGERTGTSNEEGLYLGLKLKIAREVALSSYYDQFRFPDGTSGDPFPAEGRDWLARVDMLPASDLKWLIQYRRKTLETRERQTSREGLQRTFTAVQTIERIQTRLDSRISHGLRIRASIEKLFLNARNATDRQQGTIIYEDFSCAPDRMLSLSVRVVFFSTGSYESRLYEYEDDLSGALSMPALFGQGDRWYLLLRYQPGRSCELSVKYSRLRRDDIRRLGTGPDELPGNYEDRIGVQLDFRL